MMAWIGRKKMTPSLKMVSSKLTQNRSFLPRVLLRLVTINKTCVSKRLIQRIGMMNKHKKHGGNEVLIELNESDYRRIAAELQPYLGQQSDVGWLRLADARPGLFANKSPTWIRTFIFDEFPEINIESGSEEAWVMNAHGKGKATQVYVPRARKWLDDHFDEIDWDAKL
ncbi:DUF771 domain-containing protein [Limosilactobacillus fermentum]|nr:DUF771 domain-containing protein [Limosilactobacillus fermentum]